MMIQAIIIILIALTSAFFSSAHADVLPGEAERLLPQLRSEIDKFWPGLSIRAFPAAVIEQESRWKVRAELKTQREHGVGLGQFTQAFTADGATRFDALTETKRLDPSLKDWSWQDPYNVQYQLRGVVLKLALNNRGCAPLMYDDKNALACSAAQYNGGSGSTSKRIRLCRITSGCDAGKWFDNLEHQCPQSRTKVAGYGEDFCTINSRYPGRVFDRIKKYEGKL